MHSILGSSSADIWSQCDAFVTLNLGQPEEEPTQDQRDGTAAHEIGADLVRAAAVGHSPDWSRYDGRVASDGTLFTEEMFEAARLYADVVAARMRETGIFGGPNLWIEQMLPVPSVHPAAFGTADSAIYSGGVLDLYELKFGHRYVDPFENWQAAFNFAGLLGHLGIDGRADQLLKLRFTVVQPRAYHRNGPVQTWELKASDLRGFVNRLRMAAEAQFGPNPVATSGPHCRNCNARLRCPAALHAGPALYEVAAQAVPQDMDPTALGLQATIIKRAIAHLQALEAAADEQILSLIRSGASVPGWGTEAKQGRETWTCSPQDAIAIGTAYGADISKPGVLTPNQAIKAGIPPEVVRTVTQRPARGFNIVPDDGAKIARIFSNGK